MLDPRNGHVLQSGRMLVDTHAHLMMAELMPELPDVLSRASAAGVRAIICVGIDLKSSEQAVELASRHSELYATVGVHPNDCAGLDPAWREEIRRLATSPRVVAIGEIGLDYYRDHASPEQQRRVLSAQLQIAGELGLPVVVHNRRADADVGSILTEWSRELPDAHPRGVLHCFSGDRELMDQVVEAGFYVSFAGPITYSNGRLAAEVAAAAPRDRVLVETDSPYLAPHPHRGKRNEPALVRLVVERLAQLRGVTVEEAVETTGRNAARLFGLADLPTID